MRPLGEFQTALVQNFKGSKVTVYAVPEGKLMKVAPFMGMASSNTLSKEPNYPTT